MKKLFHLLLAIFLVNFSLAFTSCCCKKKAANKNTVATDVKRDFEKEGYVKATVINYEVDGCSFMIQLEDGKKLDPSSLADDFRKDQTAVWIKYTIKKGGASVCMAGQMIDVSDIQFRK
jgi:hypothetical protein